LRDVRATIKGKAWREEVTSWVWLRGRIKPSHDLRHGGYSMHHWALLAAAPRPDK